MKTAKVLLLLSSFLLASQLSKAQRDSLPIVSTFKGQASAFLLYNPDNELKTYWGGRYIPVFNLEQLLPKKRLLDLELSANIAASLATTPFDSSATNASLKPYRAWIRYSGKQMEWRLGLQKINFGSASILRPLMWFDQIDPRDPLQITDGVYGILGRYYFLNNSNIWIWGLYGNQNPRGFDLTATAKNIPEVGARFQFPTAKGEMGLTYHYRQADIKDLGNPEWTATPENRFGIDGKWDIGIGLWVEATWIHKRTNVGLLTNQQLINMGIDYTFELGNGLNMIAEQLLIAYDEKAFDFNSPSTLTAISASYPLGLFDNLSAIIYYDWVGQHTYNFLQWRHNFSKWTLNVIAFWNPKNVQLPQQRTAENLLSAKGMQLLAVYNY